MSGHSKWATIKRKKGANDAKRGALFTKLIREITIAARSGGDPDANPRLRTAMNNARAENMPMDTVNRAILRGSGGGEGITFEEIVYEGYGPGGVALYIEVATDNRNRTASSIRHALTKHGGNLGEPNSVAWIFQKKGTVLVDKDGPDEDSLMMTALDAGAEDIGDQEDVFAVVTAPETFEAVRSSLEKEGFPIRNASLQMIPQNMVSVDGKDAERLLKLMDALDELDDVQSVSANFDIADDVLEQNAA